jgi:hypothetical protein
MVFLKRAFCMILPRTIMRFAGVARSRVGGQPLTLSSSILRWVAYPVEPFGFTRLPGELPSPLLQGEGYIFWQQPGSVEHVEDYLGYELKRIHKVVLASIPAPFIALGQA